MDKVFITPRKEIYIRDSERYETFDQVKVVINEFLVKWYTKLAMKLKVSQS